MRLRGAIPVSLRIGQAAKLVGLSTKTLKRAEEEGVLAFLRDKRGFRWVHRETFIHAPILTKRQTVKLLGIRYRELIQVAKELEALFPIPSMYSGFPLFRYFSFSAVKVLDRELIPSNRIKVDYKLDKNHWWGASLIGSDWHIHANFDAVEDHAG